MKSFMKSYNVNTFMKSYNVNTRENNKFIHINYNVFLTVLFYYTKFLNYLFKNCRKIELNTNEK